jgi:hypothetical protein
MSIAHASHEYVYKCISNHACARTAQTDRCISEILQAHTLAHSHTHTPTHPRAVKPTSVRTDYLSSSQLA